MTTGTAATGDGEKFSVRASERGGKEVKETAKVAAPRAPIKACRKIAFPCGMKNWDPVLSPCLLEEFDAEESVLILIRWHQCTFLGLSICLLLSKRTPGPRTSFGWVDVRVRMANEEDLVSSSGPANLKPACDR
jgi:hypothetical protein